jgi:RNA polymerase sigma factor (sigma-70 family)
MFNRSSNDEEIINGLRSGPRERRKAEDMLFNSFSYCIRDGMYKHSLTEDESFTAYSETILQAIPAIIQGLYREEANLKTYLHKIFNNKCIDQFRKKSAKSNTVHNKAELLDDVLKQFSDPGKSTLEQLILKYDLKELKRKLNQLGENCRKILLNTIAGYTSQEIQEELGFKSTDVVKISRLRCIERLRQAYTGLK